VWFTVDRGAGDRQGVSGERLAGDCGERGFTIEASDIGKLKTVIQIVSVVAAILDHRWTEWLIPIGRSVFVVPVHLVALAAIY